VSREVPPAVTAMTPPQGYQPLMNVHDVAGIIVTAAHRNGGMVDVPRSLWAELSSLAPITNAMQVQVAAKATERITLAYLSLLSPARPPTACQGGGTGSFIVIMRALLPYLRCDGLRSVYQTLECTGPLCSSSCPIPAKHCVLVSPTVQNAKGSPVRPELSATGDNSAAAREKAETLRGHSGHGGHSRHGGHDGHSGHGGHCGHSRTRWTR
jgi:hypothetical protein